MSKYCEIVKGFSKPENLEVLLYISDGRKGSVYKTPIDEMPTDKNLLSKITKQDFISTIRKLIGDNICQGVVHSSYIRGQFTKNQLHVILLDKRDTFKINAQTTIGKPIGFIMGRIHTKDDYKNPTEETYIDIICSCPKTGHFLLNYFIQYSETNNYDAVSLSSLDYVLTYYSLPRFGFVNRHSCKPDDNIQFVPSQQVRDDLARHDPAGGKSIFEIQSFLEYLENLRHAHFGNQKGPCNPSVNPKLNAEDYKKYQCEQDGYAMRRCNKQKLEEFPLRIGLKKK